MKHATKAALAVTSLAAIFALSACSPKVADAAPEAASEAAKAELAPGPGEPTLDQVRAATEKYKDIKVALAEGYIRDPADMCETADKMGKPITDGAMGVHYVNMANAGVAGPPNPRVDGTGINTDFLKPTVLLYEPKADGGFELVGVENLAFEKAWKAAGNTAPPSYYGVPYDHMADDPATPLDEAHGFEPHYDRHVWLYRENPKGMFVSFNPAVSCEHHKGAKAMPGMQGMAPAPAAAPAKPH
jgi:hypothetical protein